MKSVLNTKAYYIFFQIVGIFFCFMLSEYAYGQSVYTGEDTKIIDNRLDIYDKKNDFVREKMKENAMYDAIEQAIAVRVTGGNLMFQEAYQRNATESVFENHISELLKKYNLRWKRTSDYTFISTGNQKWKVSVSGTVEQDSAHRSDNSQWVAANEYEGSGMAILKNNKDIHHFKNDAIREQMKQAAIFDAIEKGASVQLEGGKKSILNSYSLNKGENISSEQISDIKEKYKIVWKRNSNFIFEKLTKNKWKVSVKGFVYNDTSANDNEETFTSSKTFIVQNRRFKKVEVNIAQKDLPSNEKHLIITKVKQRKNVSGDVNKIKQEKALLYITQQHENFAEAKIIEGFWNVSTRDVVEVGSFSTKRAGIEYNFYIDHTSLENAITKKSLTGVSVFNHAFSYFNENLISNFEFKLGYRLSMLNLGKSYTLMHSFFGGAGYHIGIIPEILYLVPGANIGITIKPDSEIKTERFFLPQTEKRYSIFLEPKLFLDIRIGIIDIVAGYLYLHLFDTKGVSGFYPTLGMKVTLNKKKPLTKNEQRSSSQITIDGNQLIQQSLQIIPKLL